MSKQRYFKKIEIQLKVKPLSVNKVWQGRRFKTKDYKEYEKLIFYLLPICQVFIGDIEIHYLFYLKNFALTDVDNLIKPLQDILVKKRIIEDDRKVVKITAQKIKNEQDKICIIIQKV